MCDPEKGCNSGNDDGKKKCLGKGKCHKAFAKKAEKENPLPVIPATPPCCSGKGCAPRTPDTPPATP